MIKRLAIFLFLFLILTAPVLAQEKYATPSAVKYELPFPGMLPDHPLYKLKVLRDKITLFLIRDPQKKTEYHLMLADKRIQMANILVDKGKIELAKETALKGEHEYTLIIFMLKDENKKPSKESFNRLEKAALKHQEVLNGILAKVADKDKKTFLTVIYFSKKNADELKTIYNTY